MCAHAEHRPKCGKNSAKGCINFLDDTDFSLPVASSMFQNTEPPKQIFFYSLKRTPVNKILNTSRFCILKKETALQENFAIFFSLY